MLYENCIQYPANTQVDKHTQNIVHGSNKWSGCQGRINIEPIKDNWNKSPEEGSK